MLSMVLFGMAIGVLICFLGGLMAIDIVPREGNRRGAGHRRHGQLHRLRALQDIVSGWLINEGKTVVDGVARYDFEAADLFGSQPRPFRSSSRYACRSARISENFQLKILTEIID